MRAGTLGTPTHAMRCEECVGMRWGRERRGTRSCVVGGGADAVRVGCGAPPHDLKQGHVLLLERGLVRVRVEVRLRELTANTPGQGWSGLVRAGQGWSGLVRAGQGWSRLGTMVVASLACG